nr:immunoglobulin light chain junction region [Macaca mulatta]MOW09912.1 immunoglobulin light chain junction region [Macaca mulatta]MOW11755.1 immunoglobulin light chain junction region [Macaca mulatta]MOW12675.1 immunoglobulin light chain junction region [Macaca mulatta]
CQQHNRYPWTF